MSETEIDVVDVVPAGWSMAKGADLFDFVRGVSYSKNDATSVKAEGHTAILRAGNLQEGQVVFDDLVYVPDAYVSDSQRLLKGDLVIAMSSGSASIVGKVALVEEDLPGVSFGAFCGLIRPRSEAVSLWLRQYFQSGAYRTLISSIAAGININNLKREHLSDLDIPLPPNSEISRATTKIEALQERSRKAREALEAIPPLLEQFRQSVLAAAFRGDLTADWREQHPDVEPASVLLDRIRVQRREKWEQAELAKFKAKSKVPKDDTWKQKYVEPQPVDDSDLPELPDGWCWATFEAIASIESNLVSPSDYPKFPHIAPDNIERATGKLLEYRTIAEDGMTSSKNRFFPGQIVYSKIRPYLSKVIVAEFDGLCSADMYPIASRINTQYLYRFMLSEFFLEAVQEEAGNRVVLPKANQEQINSIPVPVAPLEEQLLIAELAGSFAASVAIVSQLVETELQNLSYLNQSILAKAFRGELVPQDPSDEPASVLLERIRTACTAENDHNPKPKRGTTKQAKSKRSSTTAD